MRANERPFQAGKWGVMSLLTALALTCAPGDNSQVQAITPEATTQQERTVRVYKVSEIVPKSPSGNFTPWPWSDFHLKHLFPSTLAILTEGPDADPLICLIKLVQQDSHNKVAIVDDMLLLEAWPDDHKRVEMLLAEFRKAQGKRLTLAAKWVAVGNELAAQLACSENAEELLLNAIAKNQATVIYAGQSSGMDGQPLIITAEAVTLSVADIQMVIDAFAFTPTVRANNKGPFLCLEARLSHDGQAAEVQLSGCLVDPTDHSVKEEQSNTPASCPAPTPLKGMDRFQERICTISTTVQARLGQPVLAGSATGIRLCQSKSIWLLIEVTKAN